MVFSSMKCFSFFSPFVRVFLAVAFLLVGATLRAETQPAAEEWTFENEYLRVSVDEKTARWNVFDKRCNRLWRQMGGEGVAVSRIRRLPSEPAVGVEIDLSYASGKGASLALTMRVSLVPAKADVACEIFGDVGVTIDEVALPAPFVLDDPEGVLVIPHHAGLLFGVDELQWDGKALGSGFMSMPWFGAADLASGHGYLGVLETPDDASYRGAKVKAAARDVVAVQPYFISQKGKLGYARRILYHFTGRGGYVALAKRYRAYAREKGLVKTLAEKRTSRPNIDRLVGAVNIYSFGFQNIEALKRLGIERMIVSGFARDHVRQINDWGYLASHYDIYTDLYEPGTPPSEWERCQGFAFPEDVIKRADGSNQVGWAPVANPETGKPDLSYVVCATCGLRVLRERMPERLTAPIRLMAWPTHRVM